MTGAESQPKFHPAGFDDGLRLALDDVRAGRWRAMRDLLIRTGSDWALRTSRSQVLAAAAAKNDAVEAWQAEEPYDPHALMMRARVEAQRALNAHRDRQDSAWRLADEARQVCWDAARCWPEDPVPWVGLLALAAVDVADVQQRHRDHRMAPPEDLLPYGPWGLLEAVRHRDPYNREAWHRMLQALQSYGESGSNYVRWASSWAPAGSALLVLPLYTFADIYRQRSQPALYWVSESISYHTDQALRGWFPFADRTCWSPLDLNHLGQALYSGGFDEGAEVFEAIGTFATPLPWRYIADSPGRWQEEFLRARRHYLPDPPTGPTHAAGPRR